jgi:hypothetical protein
MAAGSIERGIAALEEAWPTLAPTGRLGPRGGNDRLDDDGGADRDRDVVALHRRFDALQDDDRDDDDDDGEGGSPLAAVAGLMTQALEVLRRQPPVPPPPAVTFPLSSAELRRLLRTYGDESDRERYQDA